LRSSSNPPLVKGDLPTSEYTSFFWQAMQAIECCPKYVEKRFDMSHPIDCDPEISPRVDPELCRREDSKHLKLLETLIDKIIKRLEENSCQPKIRDALKAIKLKQEVVKTSEAEKMFWEEIEAIRRCALPKLYPEPTSLESQIQATILSLKDLVKNGILPVKTVADFFNQSRSKQARLTYHRMGRLLSAMGFTKAKTPNGSSAIIWDDNLLAQDTFSNAQDFNKQEG
jgi:hypothetical protein